MKKAIKWLYRALVLVMLLVIVVPFAGSLLLQQSDYKATITSWVKDKTGRALVIDGNLGVEPRMVSGNLCRRGAFRKCSMGLPGKCTGN